MGNLSRFFSRFEFACKDQCKFAVADIELIHVLEKVREHFGKPVNVISGCRCLKYNRLKGSKDTSQHILGLASDIWIDGVKPDDIAMYVDDILLKNRGGIGLYKDFTHIDVRPDKIARWREK